MSHSLRFSSLSVFLIFTLAQLPITAQELTWLEQVPGIHQFSCLNSLFGLDGYFYATACAEQSPYIAVYRSPDGGEWQELALGARASEGIRLADGRVLLFGFSGHLIFGQNENWNFDELEQSGSIVMSAVEGNGRIILGGNSSPSRVALPSWWVSTDNGQSFSPFNTTQFTAPDYYIQTGIHGLAFGNGTFVGVGLRGESWTSTDGETWTAHSLPQISQDAQSADETLLTVQFHDGEFIATGSHMSIYRSSNGASWELLHSGALGEFLDTLVIDGDDWYAAGASGSMLWSADAGQTWNEYSRFDNLGTLVGGNGIFYSADYICPAGGPISPERHLDYDFWDPVWIQFVAYTDGKWLMVDSDESFFGVASLSEEDFFAQAITSDGVNYQHPWFGWFAARSGSWAYHFRMGWVYVASNTSQRTLLYSPPLGWFSTSDSLWPFFYHYASGHWIWYSGDPERFYNVTLSSYQGAIP